MATIKPSGILSGRQSLNRSNPHYPRLMAVTIAVILVTLALWQASATGSLTGIVSSTTLLVMWGGCLGISPQALQRLGASRSA